MVDVNYGGSTGYGRPYRERLDGKWGDRRRRGLRRRRRAPGRPRDVVDGERLAIRGGSAGGYTTLCALTFHDTFAAGASHYGVADLEALARDTHKFESRYLDGLVGPYPAEVDLYRERSPIHHTDRLLLPADRVPGPGGRGRAADPGRDDGRRPAGARALPVAYVPFEGEQHGFRQAANIIRALEAELWFYGQVFGFDPADDIEPVTGRHRSGPDGSRLTGRSAGLAIAPAPGRMTAWHVSSSPRRSPRRPRPPAPAGHDVDVQLRPVPRGAARPR